MYKLRRYEERSATTRDRTCKKVGLVSEMALSSVGWVVIPIVLHQKSSVATLYRKDVTVPTFARDRGADGQRARTSASTAAQ